MRNRSGRRCVAAAAAALLAAPAAARGALVCQDDRDDRGTQSFKVFAWDAIARDLLPADPQWNPRATRWLRREREDR